MQGSQRKWISSVEQGPITGKGGPRSQGSWKRLEAWPLFPAMFQTCSKRQQLSPRHLLAWDTPSPTPAVSPLRLPHEFSCFSNKMHCWMEIASGTPQEALANQTVAPKYLLQMCWILHWLIDCLQSVNRHSTMSSDLGCLFQPKWFYHPMCEGKEKKVDRKDGKGKQNYEINFLAFKYHSNKYNLDRRNPWDFTSILGCEPT